MGFSSTQVATLFNSYQNLTIYDSSTGINTNIVLNDGVNTPYIKLEISAGNLIATPQAGVPDDLPTDYFDFTIVPNGVWDSVQIHNSGIVVGTGDIRNVTLNLRLDTFDLNTHHIYIRCAIARTLTVYYFTGIGMWHTVYLP